MKRVSARGVQSMDWLYVPVQTCTILAFNFLWSWPPSAYAQSHYHGLELYRLCLSSVTQNLCDHDLYNHTSMVSRYISKLDWSQYRTASPYSLQHGQKVSMGICLITTSKCISKCAASWPWTISLSSHNYHCQTYLVLLSCTILSQSRFTRCEWVAIKTWMKMQTEYMTFNIHWTISSSYDLHL